jgi:hypothetical protein
MRRLSIRAIRLFSVSDAKTGAGISAQRGSAQTPDRISETSGCSVPLGCAGTAGSASALCKSSHQILGTN